jgi:O-antigen/teichoic acid export membrane protein
VQLALRHIARNVIFNWLGTIANTAVGLFLAPFILHRLGDVAYSVWVLAVSVIGYLSLLDVGMQSAVLRFVSKGYTQKDHDGASEALSAALWVRLQISVLVLVLSAGLAAAFPFLFKIPPALAYDARLATMLVGVNAAIMMSIGGVGGVLSALNRYDLQNYIVFVQTAIRVTGVVFLLRRGHGIVAIAVCELIAVIVGNLMLVWIAHRIYPQLRVSLTKPKPGTLNRIWSYSSYAFLTSVAVRLVYQTDNLVIGSIVSTAAVAVYSFANSLCRSADMVVGSMGATFVPAASTYEASGDSSRLVSLYKNGTRATLALSLPILVTFIVRGSSFIAMWVGQRYAFESGWVLRILSFALIFAFANRTAASIAFGVEKHKISSFFALGEGISNLVLSIVLAHYYGIFGVALGTMIPSLFVQLFLWPAYITRLVNLTRTQVILGVWTPLLLASLPFAAVSYFVDRMFPTHHMIVFFLQVVATLPVFFICVAFIFREYVRAQLLPRVRSFLFTEARA